MDALPAVTALPIQDQNQQGVSPGQYTALQGTARVKKIGPIVDLLLSRQQDQNPVAPPAIAHQPPEANSPPPPPHTKLLPESQPDDSEKDSVQEVFIDKQHPSSETEATRRNRTAGYLDGRMDKENHGPLMKQGKNLCDIDGEIHDSVSKALNYLEHMESFGNIKDKTGKTMGTRFRDYWNTHGKHNPNLQFKSVLRLTTPKLLKELQEKPGFLKIFSAVRALYPDLDILMVDLLRQDFTSGGNGATDYSWHQDTGSLDNPDNLAIKRTFILKLTEGASAMQIAGQDATHYDTDAGSWVDFHAGAFHKSIVVEGSHHIKIVFFLGENNRSDNNTKTSRKRCDSSDTDTALLPRKVARKPLSPQKKRTNQHRRGLKLSKRCVIPAEAPADGKGFTLYQKYSRNETQTLSGDKGKRGSWREGVKRVGKNYFLFVNLNKDKNVNARLQYHDFFIDRRTFHWQSQNRTSHSSPVGQHFIHHKSSNYTINLFVRKQVRQKNITLPFIYLGQMDYSSSFSDNPMNIVWNLHNEVPPMIFQELIE